MNNLKRVLSLALSGIMLVGMMAMGASAADFTDADKIEHDDAVNILVALSVINGQDDGSFNPEGDVTRAQMAKMIAVAMNGGSDANTGVKSTPSFTDIKGHWAESYIEYCSDLGIISGRGDGTFDPDGNVTGVEATKMVLTALGYDAKAYELTGAKWATQTEQLARQADPNLWDELSGVVMSVKASRDTAAQIIWNGLQNSTVRINPTEGRNDGTISWGYGKTGKTLLKERYDADIVMGTFTGNYNTGEANTEKGEIVVDNRVTYKDKDNKEVTTGSRYAFPSDFDISNIGEEVKVIYKNGKYSKNNGPDKNDTIFGVFPTGRTEVIWTIRGDVGSVKNGKEQVKLDDTVYEAATKVDVTFNYNSAYDVDGDKTAKYASLSTAEDKANNVKADNSDLTKKLQGNNGDTVKAIVDPDSGEITKIYVTHYVMGAVTAVNSDKVTISNVGSVDRDAADLPKDIAKGDIVVVTTLYDKLDGDRAFTIVTEAEKVSGTVTRFKHEYKDNTDGTKLEDIKERVNVKLDDTVYDIQNHATMLGSIPNETPTTTFTDECLDEEFDLYLINGYVGAAIQISEGANNYSVVTAVREANNGSGKVFQDLQIQVMDAEGTKTILSVSDDSKDVRKSDGDKLTGTKGDVITQDMITAAGENYTKVLDEDDYCVGDIVVWTGSASDAVITVKGKIATGAVKYNESTKAFEGKQIANNCVLFAETSGTSVAGEKDNTALKFKAYSLNSVRNQEATISSVVENNDGKIVALFLDLTAAPKGATDNTIYGIVTARVGRGNAADGSPYHIFTVASEDETYTVNIDVLAGVKKGDLIALEPTADSIYDKKDVTIYADQKLDADKHLMSVSVYVKEYDMDRNTLTFYTKVTGAANENKVGDPDSRRTYMLEKDAAIVYVDADGDKAGSEIGISAFDAVTGYRNAVVVLSYDKDDGYVIDAVFVETSNKCDILPAKKD